VLHITYISIVYIYIYILSMGDTCKYNISYVYITYILIIIYYIHRWIDGPICLRVLLLLLQIQGAHDWLYADVLLLWIHECFLLRHVPCSRLGWILCCAVLHSLYLQ
jgi:hypothetical protein